MRSKEALKRLAERDYLTQREHNEFLNLVKQDFYRLERLEAIEDEIGIFLDTLFNIYNKLCEQKFVYVKIGYQVKCFEYNHYLIDFKNKEIVAMEYEPENWLPFKDYGTTWALSREGLL